MRDSYWDPVNNSNKFDKDGLIEMLQKSDISKDVAAEVASQLSLVDEENNNIIFIFTDDNKYVVTGIHVPSEALDGESGPVLMRGAGDKSIIAAFSRDFIAERLDSVDSIEKKAGLPGASDALWVGQLEELAEMVRVEMKANPPASWDDLLAGE